MSPIKTSALTLSATTLAEDVDTTAERGQVSRAQVEMTSGAVDDPATQFAIGATVEQSPAAGARRKKRFSFATFRIGMIIAALFLSLLVGASIVPRAFTSLDPLEANARQAFRAPTSDHIFGTDENGRDLYTRIIYGARTSLVMGLSATAIGLTFGISIGLLAGLGSRFMDSLMMRGVDVLLAFPEILTALLILTFLGPGLVKGLIAIGIASIPQYARLARAQSQLVRRSSYVEAATTLGLKRGTLIVRHILPNAIKPVLVLALISIGGKISAGAALSFLGLGTPPPTPEWGSMLSTGREFLANAWWMTVFPGLALTFTVLSVSALGRGVLRHREGKAVS